MSDPLPMVVQDVVASTAAEADARSLGGAMGLFAAPDVSREETVICTVGQDGAVLAEGKGPS